MSWLRRHAAHRATRRDLIGPGRLVARGRAERRRQGHAHRRRPRRLADDPSVVFPRRVVTRAASAAEDHDTMSDGEFTQAVADGDFALWWEAHGSNTPSPSAIDDDIRAGRTVVCNVSRTIVGAGARRYASRPSCWSPRRPRSSPSASPPAAARATATWLDG